MLTCNRDYCDCAVTMIDDNGVTDPTKDRWERYECSNGHTFSKVLEGSDR